MAATKHSANVFLVVDPAQDYEEPLTIWGVYGSLRAAKFATPRLRRVQLWHWDRTRNTEIQHWWGDQHVASWTFHGAGPRAGTWTYEVAP